MAWPRYFPDDRIKWTDGVDSYPIWPSEPDIAVIRTITAAALNVPGDSLSVRFLADGAYHKVYDVHPKDAPSTAPAHIFRVAVPVDLVYKMESEMATLEYLRQKTTIPVSRPVAWNSSAANPLGYEWALIEKIPGVELREVWLNVPWAKKVEITEEIAMYLAQIWDRGLRFAQIGSLYFATFLDHEVPTGASAVRSSSLPSSFSMSRVEAAAQGGFRIGPAVDGDFFAGRRRYLSSNRGPYVSCRDWIAALVSIEKELIGTAKLLLEERQTMMPLDQAENWDDLIEEAGIDEFNFLSGHDSTINVCNEYLRILPLVFPSKREHGKQQETEARFLLHHCDLRAANVLVDPETFAITGIIDWERTCTVPEWYGLDYPVMINKQEPLNLQRPSDISAFAEHHAANNAIPAAAEHDRWEAKDLRGQFDRKLEQLGYSKDWHHGSPEDRLKSQFIQGVSDLSEVLERAVKRLQKIRGGLETGGDTDSLHIKNRSR